jgi:hypothetical protein
MLLFGRNTCDLENEYASHTKCDWIDGVKATFSKTENTFILSKNIVQNTDYQILPSNDKVKNYENSIISTIVKISSQRSM